MSYTVCIKIFTVSAVFLMIFSLAFPTEVAYNVKYGLSLCTNAAIPSLFMFIVLSKILSRLLKSMPPSSEFSKKVSAFLGIEPILFPICMLGLFCGAPSCCIAICDIFRSGHCSKEGAERAIILSGNCSVAFIMSIAASALQSRISALIIAVSNIITVLFVYLIFFKKSTNPVINIPKKQKNEPISAIITESISEGFSNALTLCGYILFFYTFSAILSERVYLLYTSYFSDSSIAMAIKAIITSVLELTSGTVALSSVSGYERLILTSCAVSFCSISVICQVAAFAGKENLDIKGFILSKILCAIVCPVFTLIMLFLIPRKVDVMSTHTHTLQTGFNFEDLICLVFVTVIFFIGVYILSRLDKKHKN